MKINNAVKQKFWQNWWKPNWHEKKISEKWIRNSEYWTWELENTRKWKKKRKIHEPIYELWENAIIWTYDFKADLSYAKKEDFIDASNWSVMYLKKNEWQKSIFSYNTIDANIEIKITKVKQNKRWKYYEYMWTWVAALDNKKKYWCCSY